MRHGTPTGCLWGTRCAATPVFRVGNGESQDATPGSRWELAGGLDSSASLTPALCATKAVGQGTLLAYGTLLAHLMQQGQAPLHAQALAGAGCCGF